ncbi:MAG TPA: sialidase family protein [Vicinamibacterales bacterium]|nr:sialidase family protein [Vicinamibacterales bacterium]
MSRSLRTSGLMLACVAALAVAIPAQTGNDQGRLSTPEGGGSATATWSRGPYAAAANPTPQAGGVLASCVEGVTCATIPLTIDLPADYWTRHQGVLTVTVAWPDHVVAGQSAVSNDFDVYLYDRDGREVANAASSDDPEELRVASPPAGAYSIVVYLFSVVDEGFTATATLEATAGALPEPQDDDSTLRFSPPVTLKAPATVRDGEPSTVIDQDDRWYVSAIRGVPAGSDMWIITDPAGQKFKWLGRPDTYRVQDPQTGEFREPVAADGGGDSDIAVSQPSAGAIPRLYMSSLAAATVSSAVSEDAGKTWLLNPSATLATTEDRQWNIASGENYAAIWVREPITGPGFYLYQSIDGGRTYPLVAPVYPNNGVGGQPVINHATGTVYGVISSGSNLIFVRGRRGLGGVVQTFTSKTISAGFSHGNLFPVIKIDRAGNLYAAWSDTKAVYYRYSTDDGETWSAPVRVSRGADNATVVFPAMAAGDAGRLAFAWYGTASGANTDSSADWYLWFSQTLDGLSAAPMFTQVRAVERIMHHGNISLGGLNLTNPNLNRNLIDFFQMAVDRTGRVAIAFTDDHNDFDGNTYVTRQLAGPSLFADVGTPKRVKLPPAKKVADGPEVVDFEGDTETSPATSVPAPAFDILSIDYAQETSPAGARLLVVTMRLAEMAAVPANGSWRAYLALGGSVPDKGSRYFVEATTDIDMAGGTPAFLYGTAGRLNGGAIADTRRGTADAGTITPGAPAVIQIKIDLASLGGPPPGTILHGTMGRARAAVDNSRFVLDRTRGGGGFPLR